MNWEEVGAIGQMLGSIAVFITLGYLSVQVGHAREQMSRSARAARHEAIRQYFMFEYTSSHRTEALLRLDPNIGVKGAYSAWTDFIMQRGGTRGEAQRLNFSELVYWSVAEQNIGTIDDFSLGERSQFESALRFVYGGGSSLRTKWYETTKFRLNPDAVRFIDNLLAQPDSTPK